MRHFILTAENVAKICAGYFSVAKCNRRGYAYDDAFKSYDWWQLIGKLAKRDMDRYSTLKPAYHLPHNLPEATDNSPATPDNL